MTIARQRRCYEMRTQGATWREIGEALNPASRYPTNWAMGHARRYARQRGLQWPIPRPPAGQREYEMRTQGVAWVDVAKRLGLTGECMAIQRARRWAHRSGAQWPIQERRHAPVGEAAYRLAAGGMSWCSVAMELNNKHENVQNCARYYARSRQLPWPPAPGGTP